MLVQGLVTKPPKPSHVHSLGPNTVMSGYLDPLSSGMMMRSKNLRDQMNANAGLTCHVHYNPQYGPFKGHLILQEAEMSFRIPVLRVGPSIDYAARLIPRAKQEKKSLITCDESRASIVMAWALVFTWTPRVHKDDGPNLPRRAQQAILFIMFGISRYVHEPWCLSSSNHSNDTDTHVILPGSHIAILRTALGATLRRDPPLIALPYAPPI